jgi:glycosyltransferase involved in cell wall biosynthesis
MKQETISILFIGPHRPGRNPSQRFRMEQYFPYLQQEGFRCDYSWFINEEDDELFYSKGHIAGKFLLLLKAVRVRLGDLLQAKKYDIVFVQREAFMTGSVFFEKRFARSGARLVYDFDDAIWLQDTSAANQNLSWLKRPSKIADIIKVADLVIAGNQFLADYAKTFNSNIVVIPTVVDTAVFKPGAKLKAVHAPVCIGWTGSSSTIKHFQLLLPVFRKLKEHYKEHIVIRLIGDKKAMTNEPWIEQVSWNASGEVADLRQLDIGVMPLPDDAWSKGKCGFKAIQYMSLGIPCVVSPVGVNTEIIQHGINGMHAQDEEAWITLLSKLIESTDLRKEIGEAGRQTILQKYSVQAQLPLLITKLRSVIK